MSRLTTLLAASLLACSLRPPIDGDSGATAATTGDASASTTSGQTTGPTSGPTSGQATGPSTGPSTGPASTDTGAVDTTCSFVCDDTGDPPAHQCDPWLMPEQDCPAGQKCTFDGQFGHTHCVDIVPDPHGLYEPCMTLPGGQLGDDDCAAGLVCWNVDPETGVGFCIGFCLGPADAPTCADPGASCVVCQECNPAVCLPGCDPLAQDCVGQDLCIPDGFGDKFVCVLDASGDAGQAFDPCEFANTCDPGLTCADPAFAKECDPMASGCCLPFCDLTMPTCPGDGLTCAAWFEPGKAPPGLENVGLCRLPP